jgi:hypothetical protein
VWTGDRFHESLIVAHQIITRLSAAGRAALVVPLLGTAARYEYVLTRERDFRAVIVALMGGNKHCADARTRASADEEGSL